MDQSSPCLKITAPLPPAPWRLLPAAAPTPQPMPLPLAPTPAPAGIPRRAIPLNKPISSTLPMILAPSSPVRRPLIAWLKILINDLSRPSSPKSCLTDSLANMQRKPMLAADARNKKVRFISMKWNVLGALINQEVFSHFLCQFAANSCSFSSEQVSVHQTQSHLHFTKY